MSTKPHLAHTIDKFINSANLTLFQLKDFVEWTKIGNIKYPSYITLHDYKSLITPYTEKLTLVPNGDEKLYYKYLMKPELLAFDLYGYTDLSFLLLFLNNIYNPKEFDFRVVNVLHPDHIPILSKIKNQLD